MTDQNPTLLLESHRLRAWHGNVPIGGYPIIAPKLLALAHEARRTLQFRQLIGIHRAIRDVRQARDKAIAQRAAAALKLKKSGPGKRYDAITRWYICASGQFELLPDSPAEIKRTRDTWERKGAAVGLNVPQKGYWEPYWPPSTTPTIIHAPAPGTGTPEPGTLALVENLRRGMRPYPQKRRTPGRLSDEFEHYICLAAPDMKGAYREYWRHVANRAALAILADNRLPAIPPRPSSPSRTPPSAPPRTPVGGNVFVVQAEAVQLTIGDHKMQTQPLALEMLVDPASLPAASRKTLETLRQWPTPQSVDVLFKYQKHVASFRRRSGLSGDILHLFEVLLAPHDDKIRRAFGRT